MTAPIKVFGEKARDINEGDTFRAKIRYVEGRKVVLLVSVKAGNTPADNKAEAGE